jgi:hypothetical protein
VTVTPSPHGDGMFARSARSDAFECVLAVNSRVSAPHYSRQLEPLAIRVNLAHPLQHILRARVAHVARVQLINHREKDAHMKLTHIVIAAGTAVLSFGALAEGSKAMHDRQSGASATMQHESQASSSVIKQAQQKLSAAGHDAGPADGVMGPKTAQALRDFQQAKGIEASGQLDARTLAALGLESGGVGATLSSGSEASVGASAGSGSGESGGSSGQRTY